MSYNKSNLLTEIDQTYPEQGIAPIQVFRTSDGYGGMLSEYNKINGLVRDNWQENHDAAVRRIGLIELNFSSTPYAFTYQANGAMTSASFNGSTSSRPKA